MEFLPPEGRSFLGETMNQDNYFTITGFVGAIRRKESAVFLRVCVKNGWYSEKQKEYIHDERWFSISFFGRHADAAEEKLRLNDYVLITGELNPWPREGPLTRVRLNGFTFKPIDKEIMFRGKARPAPVDPGDFDEEEPTA